MPRLAEMPLGRFLNFVWWWLTRNAASEKDVLKIRAQLWRPPKGEEPTRGPWSPEAETRALQSFKKQLGR